MTDCTLCASTRVATAGRYRSPFVDRDYTLHECADCGSAFFDVDEHDIDLTAIYNEHAEEQSSTYTAAFRPSFHWRRQVRILTNTARRPVQSVLDVGCRTGDFLMHWPADIQRTGIELSEAAARTAVARGLDIRTGYLEEIVFENRFDVVTCYAVVEHLRDPTGFLRRLSDLVDEGGVAAVMIPTRQCLKHRIATLRNRKWHMYSPPQHLAFLSRGHLDRVMRENGFERVSRRYTSGGMINPFPPASLTGRAFSRFMTLTDNVGPFNRAPVFDHMYSYFVRAR